MGGSDKVTSEPMAVAPEVLEMVRAELDQRTPFSWEQEQQSCCVGCLGWKDTVQVGAMQDGGYPVTATKDWIRCWCCSGTVPGTGKIDATDLSGTLTYTHSRMLTVKSFLTAYDAEGKVATWEAVFIVPGKTNKERPDGGYTATDKMDFSAGKRTVASTGTGAAAQRPPMVWTMTSTG
jgi:hypothetical protein